MVDGAGRQRLKQFGRDALSCSTPLPSGFQYGCRIADQILIVNSIQIR
jgi:hypothetical protein